MSSVTKLATGAVPVGTDLTVNLRESTTWVPRVAVQGPQAPFVVKTKFETAPSLIKSTFEASAHKLLPTPVAQAVTQLWGTKVVQNTVASAAGVAVSVGGMLEGLGDLYAGGIYGLLPPQIGAVLAHPQVAQRLSEKTGGASRVVTDTVAQLEQSNKKVSAGLTHLITRPHDVAAQAWNIFHDNVLTNPLNTTHDWFRGVKTVTDVGLLLGLGRVAPQLDVTSTAVIGPAITGPAVIGTKAIRFGRTIDLDKTQYRVVREGDDGVASATVLPAGSLQSAHAVQAQHVPSSSAMTSVPSGSLFPTFFPPWPRRTQQWGAPTPLIAVRSGEDMPGRTVQSGSPDLLDFQTVKARQARPATLERGAEFSPLPPKLLNLMDAKTVEQAAPLRPLDLIRDSQTGGVKIIGSEFELHVNQQGQGKLMIALGADESKIDGMPWNLLGEQIVETLNRERIPVSEIEINIVGITQRIVVVPDSNGTTILRYRVDLTDGVEVLNTYEFGHRLESNELVINEQGRYLVFEWMNGLKAANGPYYTVNLLKRQYGKRTITSRNPFSLEQIEEFRMKHFSPYELGVLTVYQDASAYGAIFQAGESKNIPVGPRSHPQFQFGGRYSMTHGFFPNRSPELSSGIATLNTLLSSKGKLVPGYDGVQIEQGLSDEMLFQIASDLGGNGNKLVEVNHMWADGNDYLMSGNFHAAPLVPDWNRFQRIHSMGHVHPNGVLLASEVGGDTDVARMLYLHTLKSFPNERLLTQTRVVAKSNGTVQSQSYGPTRDIQGEMVRLRAQDLGLSAMDGLTVQMRRNQNNVTVMRIDLPQSWSDPKTTADTRSTMGSAEARELAIARGTLIRAALLEEAKKRGSGVVTFEVSLENFDFDEAVAHQIIVGMQGNRLVQSMVEARYGFYSGTYWDDSKILVWHEDLNAPTRHVSNREVWLGEK